MAPSQIVGGRRSREPRRYHRRGLWLAQPPDHPHACDYQEDTGQLRQRERPQQPVVLRAHDLHQKPLRARQYEVDAEPPAASCAGSAPGGKRTCICLRFPTVVGNLTQMHVRFPPGAVPAQLVAVHPTQIYETVLMLLVFWWLWRRREHSHAVGWRFGVYLVLAGAERFLVEVVRAKDDRLLGPFTVAQLTSVLVMAAGVWVIAWLREPEAAPVLPAGLTGTTAADDLARRH